MKVYAPVKDFNGWRNNVRFVNGVGETNDPRMIEWFRTHGYKVPLEQSVDNLIIPSTNEQIESKNDKVIVTSEPNFDEMTPNELREWAKENGFGSQIKNTRNKDKLLEIIRG